MNKNTLSGLTAEEKYAAIEMLIKEYLSSNPSFKLDKDEVSQIDSDTDFDSDFGLDSLDRIELVMQLERETGVTISDEDAESATTVGKMIECFIKNS